MEGSETRSRSPERTVKAHECAATSIKKRCNECGEEKPLSEYHKQSACKYGVRNKCKDCAKARAIRNYHENRESRVQRKRKYNAATRDHRLAYLRDYRSKDEKRELISSLRSRWNAENPDRLRAMRARHSVLNNVRRSQAIPAWADRQYMNDIYKSAAEAEAIFQAIGLNTKLHVDHIVPIVNDRVCGLHNEFNLQILTREQNLQKYNRFEIG